VISEHLTINGFDSRVYLGAARAQAAAMRANGQKNQSRHTVLGGTTIDVRIQDSHTYIKIDTGGGYVRFFFVFARDNNTHVYMCDSLRSSPVEIVNNLPLVAALPTKATYIGGSVVLTPTYSTGCISVRLADKSVSIVAFPEPAGGVYFQSSVAYATAAGKLGVLAAYRPLDTTQKGVIKVYEGSPAVEVATFDLPVEYTYSFVVLDQTDTHYLSNTTSSTFMVYECVSLGPGHLLVLGQLTETYETDEWTIIPPPGGVGDALDGSTRTVTSTYTATFSAIYSTDYGRTWALTATLPGGITPPVDTSTSSASYEKTGGVMVQTAYTNTSSGGAGVPSAANTTTSKKDKGHVGWGDIHFSPGTTDPSAGVTLGYSMQPPATVVAVSTAYTGGYPVTKQPVTYLGSSTWLYGSGGEGVYRTLDNGMSWSIQYPVTDSIITTGAVSLDAVVEGGSHVSSAWALCSRPGTLAITLHASQDGGANWAQVWNIDATAGATNVIGPSGLLAAIIPN
jgi:hypothetical protein